MGRLLKKHSFTGLSHRRRQIANIRVAWARSTGREIFGRINVLLLTAKLSRKTIEEDEWLLRY